MSFPDCQVGVLPLPAVHYAEEILQYPSWLAIEDLWRCKMTNPEDYRRETRTYSSHVLSSHDT